MALIIYRGLIFNKECAMHHLLKTVLFSVLVVASLTACKKAQEESAEAARETITEMKASTIDAANEAAAQAERTANDIAQAADAVGASVSGTETADK
jgi:mannitol-specific phosphotransferase system IIBC component